MTDLHWNRIKASLEELRQLPPDEREAFVVAASVGDPALQAELASLLPHIDGSDSFLEQPALAALSPHTAGAVADAFDLDDLVGQRVGPYLVERRIGRGGMGTVYLATRVDGAFRQQVAVKVIARGMNTEAMLRRFRAERAILAALTHPYIARLLDGGTTPDARPYLALEYVDGQSMTHYCDAQRLTVDARLALFRKVCAAVQFAHQRLVIHRDLKAGNILVTADGTPKLLDFGIAKLLTDDLTDESVPVTGSAMRLMTPDYAAPEQVRGEAITTATDVYALGVLLYELLTGTRPYRLAGRTDAEIRRAVCDTEVARPSTAIGKAPEASEGSDEAPQAVSLTAVRGTTPEKLRRRLSGDLDTIVLTALRKEPERRYGSVEQLSDDIRRHLEGRPVTARADTWRYRTGKFVARNRLAVAAAVVVLLTLVGGIVATTRQARIAQRRFDQVRSVANALLFDLQDEMDKGAVEARRLLVARATTYLESLAAEAGGDVELQHEAASGYERLAKLEGSGSFGDAQLGDIPTARAHLQKARELRERVQRRAPMHYGNRRGLADQQMTEAMVAINEGRPQEGLVALRAAVQTLEGLHRERPDDHRTSLLLGKALYNQASAESSGVLASAGTREEAGRLFALAIEVMETLAAAAPQLTAARATLATLLDARAEWYRAGGQYDEAFRWHRMGLTAQERLVADYPAGASYRRELAVSYGNFAAIATSAGRHADARDAVAKALPLFETLAAADPRNVTARQDLAVGHRNMARALTTTGEPARALPHLDRAAVLFADIARLKPEDAFITRQIAFTHLVASASYAGLGRHIEALEHVRQGMGICDTLLDKDRRNMSALRTLAILGQQGGDYAMAVRRQRDAAHLYARSREAWVSVREISGSLGGPDAKRLAAVESAIARLGVPR